MRTKALVLSVLAILFFSLTLQAESIRHVRTIDLNQDGKGGKLSTLLFGKKDSIDVKASAICFLEENRFCVVDTMNGAVIIADPDGRIRKRHTRAGKFRFVSPVSACTDSSGNLYVSDSAGRWVARFSGEGDFIDIFLEKSDSRITGILWVGDNFYGVDTLNHRIIAFDRFGKSQKIIGKRGSAAGEFNYPTHIDSDGKFLYITDAMNFRVQILDLEGKHQRSFGKPGRGGGSLSKPKGLAVDRNGRIFISDVMFDNIQIFSFEGDFLSYFGGPGHKDGEFWMPNDVAIDGDGSIWVADTFNNRIQVFHFSEEQP
ncbi:MAG: 6-bladed beta-propeller [Candidatus Aminicenantes bacterium]|nr:6-bladed beta-propeller [Candidatus Aminicenantes bacterium]